MRLPRRAAGAVAASMAGALITSLPTLVVYVVLGRWFIGGLMAGSVKS